MYIFIKYLVYVVLALVSLLVIFIKWSHSFWKRQGVAYIEPTFLFGNVKESLTRKKAFFYVITEIYNKFKEKGVKYGGIYFLNNPILMVSDPELIKDILVKDFELYVSRDVNVQGVKYGGIYFLTNPILMVSDPELIKVILVKDFEYFTSHGTYSNESLEPLTGNLFNLEGSRWKALRAKLTPTFTSNQMRMMFQTLAKCAPELTTILENHAKNAELVDIKDILARFTVDVIGNCAFGIECNTMANPNSEFGIQSKKLFQRNPKVILKRAISQLFPKKLITLMGIKIQNQEVANFFMDVVRQNANYREKNNIFRKDFFHLLLQLKNRGQLADDGSIKKENFANADSILNIDEIAAHCFIFFGAGFETSSTTMAFAFYEIANNEDLQDKVRNEVLRVLENHNDKLSYEAVMEMHYLEKVIYETLRKYPPAPILPRKCTKSYTIPDSTTTLKKGTTIYIPVCAIQRDAQYYPDPDSFDPERFSEEAKRSRPQYTWLPFGEGPRICIGLRFGIIQSKVGLATILRDFKLKVNKKTIIPLEIDSRSLVTSAKGGIWLDVEKL